MPEKTAQMILAGTLAPSGDNSQPWSFSVYGDSVSVRMHPEKDHALLNVEKGGTLIASGAVLENMIWQARALGCDPGFTLLPDFDQDIVGEFVVKEGGAASADSLRLAAAISERHTNRAPYSVENLPVGFMTRCLATAGEYEPCSFTVVNTPETIAAAAGASSAMEEIALQDERIHKLFFDSILWSMADHRSGKPGLHIRTLELPGPARLLFRFLRHWRVIRLLNRLGFAKMAARGNAQVYASSGAMVAIIAPDRSAHSMLQAGRLIERIWLEATAEGLAAQPLAGLLYLAEASRRDPSLLAEPLGKRAAEADASIREMFEVPDNAVLAMLLRVGKPMRPPSDHSRRALPVVL